MFYFIDLMYFHDYVMASFGFHVSYDTYKFHDQVIDLYDPVETKEAHHVSRIKAWGPPLNLVLLLLQMSVLLTVLPHPAMLLLQLLPLFVLLMLLML